MPYIAAFSFMCHYLNSLQEIHLAGLEKSSWQTNRQINADTIMECRQHVKCTRKGGGGYFLPSASSKLVLIPITYM